MLTEQEITDDMRALLSDIEAAISLKSAARISVLQLLSEQLTLAIMHLGQCESDLES